MKKIICLLTFILSACSNLSPPIQTAPADDLQFEQAEYRIDKFIGKSIRWGGKIISVSKYSSYTRIEIEQFPLTDYGFPLLNHPSKGRFIGQGSLELDSSEYQQGLLITFAGTIDSEMTRIGDREKEYLPVVNIIDAHLWPYGESGGIKYPHTGAESRYQAYGYYGSGDF